MPEGKSAAMISVNADEIMKLDMLAESLRNVNGQLSLAVRLCSDLETGADSLAEKLRRLRMEADETAAALREANNVS